MPVEASLSKYIQPSHSYYVQGNTILGPLTNKRKKSSPVGFVKAETSLGNGRVQIIFLKCFGKRLAARIAMKPQEVCNFSGSHTILPKLLNGLSATASFVIKSQDIQGQTHTTMVQ